MMKYSVVFVAVFLLASAQGFKFNPFGIFGSSEEDDSAATGAPGGGFPFPTFLVNQDLLPEQLKAWFDIEKNQDLTKAQITEQQDLWALNQSEQVQQGYSEWKQQVQAFVQKLVQLGDDAVASASDSIKALYEQVKAIRLDASLTSRAECEQIRAAFKAADQTDVMDLLRIAPGIQGRCFGPRVGDQDNRGERPSPGPFPNSGSSEENTITFSTTSRPGFFKRVFGF